MNETCENCKYAKYTDHLNMGYFLCRRYPPTVVPECASVDPFPVVKSNTWCGEYESAHN